MEGPSLVILKEELTPFLGKTVLVVQGNTKQPKESLKGRKLSRIETWGKVLFLSFTKAKAEPVTTKTHFLMFGSYRINDSKEGRDPRLELRFRNGTVYFYSASIQFGEDVLKYKAQLDPRVDIMSSEWSLKEVLKQMRKDPGTLLCDLLLNQKIFAGSGNIVKNEVLFNLRSNPLLRLSDIPEEQWPKIARAVRDYGADFYRWKKKFELRQHWQVYRKSTCPACGTKVSRQKLGKFERATFFCPNCQAPRTRIRKLEVHKVLPIRAPVHRERELGH